MLAFSIFTRNEISNDSDIAIEDIEFGIVDQMENFVVLTEEDVIKGKLHYYINANVSYNRNKIIFQDEVEPNEPYQWRTGQPVGTIFGYVADGFYNDSDFENGKLKEGFRNQPWMYLRVM